MKWRVPFGGGFQVQHLNPRHKAFGIRQSKTFQNGLRRHQLSFQAVRLAPHPPNKNADRHYKPHTDGHAAALTQSLSR